VFGKQRRRNGEKAHLLQFCICMNSRWKPPPSVFTDLYGAAGCNSAKDSAKLHASGLASGNFPSHTASQHVGKTSAQPSVSKGFDRSKQPSTSNSSSNTRCSTRGSIQDAHITVFGKWPKASPGDEVETPRSGNTFELKPPEQCDDMDTCPPDVHLA
jgi:hypothetical protein